MTGWRRLSGVILAAGLVGIVQLGAGAAQEQPHRPFLYINRDTLMTGSRVGQALLAEQEAQLDRLRAEARAIDAAFEAEERQLTEERGALDAEAFRAKADDFDRRVVAARREQDERSGALAQEFDQERRQFYAQIAPILVQFMDRYGAQAIFDEASILLADQSINITAAVIAAIDAQGGAGATAEPQPTPAEPVPAPAAPEPMLEAPVPPATGPVARPPGGN